MTFETKVAVVAIGGNSLIRDRNHESIPDQYATAVVTVHQITNMIESGWNVIITHGNGPQLGFVLRRAELAIQELPPVPMDYAGADLQGALGYMLVKAFRNEFRRRSANRWLWSPKFWSSGPIPRSPIPQSRLAHKWRGPKPKLWLRHMAGR